MYQQLKDGLYLEKLNCYKSAGGHRKFHLNHIKEFLKKDKSIHTNINVFKINW